MTKKELNERIDEILTCEGDAEVTHELEDVLYNDLVKDFCPNYIQKILQRLKDAHLARWYA